MSKENCFLLFILAIHGLCMPCVSSTVEGAGHSDSSCSQAHFQEVPNTLNCVWNSPDGKFVVGGLGILMHSTGDEWTQYTGLREWSFHEVWGGSIDDLFAVTTTGDVARFSESTWELAFESEEHLWDLWGNSNSDVFAVGDNGAVLHYDGTSWNRMRTGATSSLVAVHGASSSSVFAVGFDGTVVFFDGTTWTRIDAWDEPVTLKALWSPAEGEVYVGGSNGLFAHFQNGVWEHKTDDNKPDDSILDLCGDAEGNLFAIWGYRGRSVWRFDGSEWTRYRKISSNLRPRKLAVSPNNEVVVIGLANNTGAQELDCYSTGGAIVHYRKEVE